MPSLINPSTLFRLLLLPALIAFLYLYFYPAINSCAFPPATKLRTKCSNAATCRNTTVPAGTAPFRLLALADPQLEGDTSFPPGWNDGAATNLQRIWTDALAGRWESLGETLPALAQGYRKKLDLWGNDLFLAHIHRQTRWWAGPTHTVVLGDLLGSQWIGDGEFGRRAGRFWDRVFSGAERVPDHVMEGKYEGEVLGVDGSWKRRVIAVAGNHDVGYAGDLNEGRVERFENAFGRVNWEVVFRLPNATLKSDQDFPSTKNPDFYDGPGPQPELRLLVLNSMNLDEPARSPALREQSVEFMDNTLCDPDRWNRKNAATVLLTHIPLHKETGVCVDGPFFSYFSPEHGGGIHEQNHLSEQTSSRILDCLAQNKPSIVLNGHDHEGCDTYHYTPSQSSQSANDDASSASNERKAIRTPSLPSLSSTEQATALREITVRSMMGSYGGHAGFLSGWYNAQEGEWQFEYETCGFGVQHIWWVCNVLLLLEVGLGVFCTLDVIVKKAFEEEERGRGKVKEA